MSEFNKHDFIDNTIDAVLRAFESVKVDDGYYDCESDEWAFDKIREDYRNEFQCLYEDVLYDKIEMQLTYPTDSWKICQLEIGERNFSNYSSSFTGIQSLARDVLRFIVGEKYDFDEILERYFEGLEPPEKVSKN